MLRHILLIRLKPTVTAEQVDAFVQAIESLPFPGGTTPSLADDPGHGQVRTELLAPIAERIERCLFYV